MITFEVKEDRRIRFSCTRWGYHRRGKVAYTSKYTNGKKHYETYYIHHKRHRLNGPAHTLWHDNGQKYCETYCIHDAFQSRKFWDKQESLK